MGGTGNPEQMMAQMEAMLSNPAMANMMQGMMSNPQVMQQMMDSDPRMRAMLDSAPGMREQLADPEFLRRMTNPDNLRAMMQMQRAMAQLQGNGVMPPGGMPGGGVPGGAPGRGGCGESVRGVDGGRDAGECRGCPRRILGPRRRRTRRSCSS
jgi:ubiquilin